MKFTAIIAPLLALVPVCTANFDIYMNNAWTVQGGSTGWTIFEADPPCGQVNNAIIYGNYGDVSGSYIGVRCVGDCFPSNRPDGIQILEMHFNNNPLYHWTIYKDRGYKMYGLDGKVYGECILFPGHNYRCDAFGITEGYRKFRCLTQFTARQITGRN
ncbi:hypothetical protein CH63R_01455 [Colletotrichum higginsianum IMI 349063]|uniref:Uncharacterized protein n=2 Tax=Colletotrichum higginsianum TaxID=80884 RepID=A0A1B7YW44_COLHI|nr:hypothetical protein CH63R_01455 [Colletotrichum higginsianum IMI 349063]OBR16275.1 hypothetical protein CH63R_01455 [Colletotrichum higginsianum IMI 349063]TID04095.1 hypothetical protein CH35J_002015 [Colletotrichum higginsianum]GJC91479.1 hypothetical protein ColKHC_00305 [Colletotrichum higginsianum]